MIGICNNQLIMYQKIEKWHKSNKKGDLEEMTFGNNMRLMNPPLWKDQVQPIRTRGRLGSVWIQLILLKTL